MSEVTSYFMSKEELAARQESRKNRHKPIPKPIKNWQWNRISEKRYMQLTKDGLTEKEMIKEIPWLTQKTLDDSKREW